jgi:hypothetical protein
MVWAICSAERIARATVLRVGLHAVAVGITQFPPTYRFSNPQTRE